MFWLRNKKIKFSLRTLNQKPVYHVIYFYRSKGSSKTLLPDLLKNGINCELRKLHVGDLLWVAKEKVKPLPGTKLSIVSGCPLVRVKVVKFCFSSRSGKSVKWSGKLETLQKSGIFKIMFCRAYTVFTFNVRPCVHPSVCNILFP